MDYLEQQTQQSLNPHDYATVICVCGTREWNDKWLFHTTLIEYLKDITGPVLFVSGAAPSGADDLIIQWCRKFRFPCKEFAATWKRPDGSTDRGAGHKRNEQMALVITHTLAFHDGKSPGTTNMIERSLNHGRYVKIINISGQAELPTNFQLEAFTQAEPTALEEE